jgi:hypothetical protein
LYPPPEGLVSVWSNLEFDTYLPGDVQDRELAAAWIDVNAFAQSVYETTDIGSSEFDDAQVPRTVLAAVCRILNDGGWEPSRPTQLAPDGVIYPAALGGVDPDTADNLAAALNHDRRQQLDDAGLLLR